MAHINLQHIQNSQSQYRQLIEEFTQRYDIDELTWNQIASFLDEVEYFWRRRLDIIDVELEALTESNICFLLSGAIYLNVSDNEHYYFKSLGDFHILPDPFLKIEHFFRVSKTSFDSGEIFSYFRRVLNDTLEILEKFRDAFFILPIRLLATEDTESHHELLDKFFLNFLSSVFDKEYEHQDEFCDDYESFEQIESKLEPYIRERLIFNDPTEGKLPLRRKIEIYHESQISFTKLLAGQSEARVFLVTLYSYLSQISDILLVCTMQRLNPYIRFEITFHYLLLVMYTFLDDENLRNMIEKTIIFYIFRKVMDGAFEQHESFNDYWINMSEKKALPKIIDKMREQKIDIFHGGVRELEAIIANMFTDAIQHSQTSY
jgi:hypothetical protein